MISPQGDSPSPGAGVPVAVQSCIEQERRDCRLLFLLTAVCALTVALAVVALLFQRCNQQQPVDLEKVNDQWRQESSNTNLDERGVAGPLPPYLERLSTNR